MAPPHVPAYVPGDALKPTWTERVSIHESAHTIIALAHDVEVIRVSLHPGRTTFAAPIADPWTQLLVSVAAREAEIAAFGDYDKEGVRYDDARADVAAFAVGGWDGFDNALRTARGLCRVLVSLNWADIQDVALRLLAAPDGVLTGDAIAPSRRVLVSA
jgi:hypothetical protein